MYRTPFASIRVPDIDDVDMRQALIDAFTDIQYRTERNAARVAELQRRRGAAVSAVYGTPLASGAVVTVPWGAELYDSDAYVDLAVSTTNVVVPRGLFLVTASAAFIGSGNINTAQVNIAGSVSTNIASTQSGPFGYTSLVTLSTVGVFYSAAGENVTMTVYQISGGAGIINSAEMAVAKIGIL